MQHLLMESMRARCSMAGCAGAPSRNKRNQCFSYFDNRRRLFALAGAPRELEAAPGRGFGAAALACTPRELAAAPGRVFGPAARTMSAKDGFGRRSQDARATCCNERCLSKAVQKPESSQLLMSLAVVS